MCMYKMLYIHDIYIYVCVRSILEDIIDIYIYIYYIHNKYIYMCKRYIYIYICNTECMCQIYLKKTYGVYTYIYIYVRYVYTYIVKHI